MLITPTLLLFGSAFSIDAVGRELAADVKLAIDRSGHTQDWYARVIGTTPSKLSVQVNGQAPFTLFCRFWCAEVRDESEFWYEFRQIQERRVNQGVDLAQAQIGLLVAKVEVLTEALTDVLSGKRSMPYSNNLNNERRSA